MSRYSSGLLVCLPLVLSVACGGATDIDYQGPDGGATGGSAGSGGSGGSAGLATGGSGDAGSVGGSGGTGGSGHGGDAGSVDAGQADAGGSGGAAGAGQGGGGVAGSQTGGSGGGTMIHCAGPSDCPVPGGLPIQVDPCCTPQGTCGVSSSFIGGGQCVEGGQPGEPSSQCKGISQGGFTLAGCCKPDGTCGVLDTFLGLGCVDPAQFGGPGGGTCTP